MTRLRAQDQHDFFDGTLRLVFIQHIRFDEERRVVNKGADTGGQFIGRRDYIRQPRVNRALGHPVKFCRF